MRAIPGNAISLLLVMLLTGCGMQVRQTADTASGVETAPIPSVAEAVESSAPDGTEPAEPPSPRPKLGDPDSIDPFQRFRAAASEPQCRENRVVSRWIERHTRRPDIFRRELSDMLPLFDQALDQVVAGELPAELALLPVVESRFHPNARNHRNAGMWQLADATARELGLRVDPGRDDRLDPIRSSQAAVALLQRLHQRFGDWRLDAMAFNAGEYRVAKALANMPDDKSPSGAEHQPPGLSMITYEYIAQIEALSCLLIAPQRYAMELPGPEFVRLREVPVPAGFRSVHHLAELTGVDADAVSRINAVVGDGRLRGVSTLLLPEPEAQKLQRWNLDIASGQRPPPPPEPPHVHAVVRGDSLWAIARHYGVSVASLRRWNGMGSSALLHPGQMLRLEP